MAAFDAYAADLTAAGVLVTTEVLEPVVAATTVTARNGKPEIQDGPFADTKERLGGIFVIEVADLDEALKWAQRNPANDWGSIEIRPVARTAADRGWYTRNGPGGSRMSWTAHPRLVRSAVGPIGCAQPRYRRGRGLSGRRDGTRAGALAPRRYTRQSRGVDPDRGP